MRLHCVDIIRALVLKEVWDKNCQISQSVIPNKIIIFVLFLWIIYLILTLKILNKLQKRQKNHLSERKKIQNIFSDLDQVRLCTEFKSEVYWAASSTPFAKICRNSWKRRKIVKITLVSARKFWFFFLISIKYIFYVLWYLQLKFWSMFITTYFAKITKTNWKNQINENEKL